MSKEISCLLALWKALTVRERFFTLSHFGSAPSVGCICRLAVSGGWENSSQAAASSPSSLAQGQHQPISCWLPANMKHTSYKLTALRFLTLEFLSPGLQLLSLPSTLWHRTWARSAESWA